MKKLIVSAITATVIATAFAPVRAEASSRAANLRPASLLVCGVDYEADEVELIDATGNAWIMTGAEDWIPGDIAAVIFDTCGTAEIFDDEIIVATYTGTVEDFEMMALENLE